MDPNKHQQTSNTAKKTPTGIPTRSSGIPAPSVRRSVAPNEAQQPLTPSSSSSAVSSAAAAAAAATGKSEETTSKLQPSSSQKNVAASQIKPPSTTIPVLSSSSQHQMTASDGSGAQQSTDSEALKSQIKDLTEKLDTLKTKRAEDREKLREAEKLKLQNQQLNEFKTKAQEIISNLNKEIQQTKAEASSIKEQYESYKETMNSHEQRLEEMTVDKELAEAKLEEMQDELVKLTDRNEELKLELDVLKGEIEVGGVEGAASSFHNKQAEKEIENLKAALLKLRDLSLADKTEINRLKKLSEESTTKLAKAQKENEQLKSETATQLAQINELNDQVTATLGSVQMIEQLTEQNLDLEEKLAEMRETITDLEAINDVNDQLQENAREEERELRRSLDMSEARVREAERQIELLKYNLADQEKTILKFRELVKQLQDEKDMVSRKLKSKLEEKIEQASKQEGQTGATFDFKQKFIETQNLAIQIENEINRIELFSNRKYISYLLSFFPENFVKQSGENECLLSVLFFKRISSKCDFLIGHFKDKISNEFLASSEEPNKQLVVNSQLEFYYNISMYSALIKLICDKFDYILNNCDLKVFNNIGSMFYDFNLNEKNFEALFELLQKDQLDETYSFDNLEKTFVHFDTIFKNHLPLEKFDHLTYLDDFFASTLISAETLGVVLKRLEKLIETKEDSAEIVLLFKEIACKNDENKHALKKFQRHLQKEEKNSNKVTVELSSELVVELDKTLSNYFLVFKSIKELYNLVSTYKSVSSGDGEVMSAKHIEELAYQACDKVYIKDDNGPYENLRNSVKQIRSAIDRLGKSLESGEFEKKLTEEEFKIKKYQVNCPVLKRAEDYKNTLIEAENIKYKLEAKDEEIKELKKNLKLKADELSEQKLRISLVEKKGETAAKEVEEKNKGLKQTIQDLKDQLAKSEKDHFVTIEAMQQELDNLENERRELKEKLRNTAKKAIFDNLVNRRDPNSDFLSSPSDPSRANLMMSSQMSSSGDTYSLYYEINVLRNSNRLLQKNFAEINKQYAKSLCEKFSALPKLEHPYHQKQQSTVANLSKQSSELMTNLFDSLGSIKVEKLSKKSHSNENKKNTINILMIKSKISSLESTLSSLKQHNKSGEKKKLIAEISFPRIESRTTPTSRTIDMSLNLDDIKQLLRKI